MGKFEELINKQSYDFEDLAAIMKILMSPQGCPWDRAQTHESICINAIEEAYEVVDAVQAGGKPQLIEELGDLLLQSVFHGMIAERDNEFYLQDVLNSLCKKLIFRHKHVFGDIEVSDAHDALAKWDKAKALEKTFTTVTQDMRALPKVFPQLLRAQKVQKKAAKVGFDFTGTDQAFEKVDEEIGELKEAIKAKDMKNAFEELGDCFFSLVNIARFIGADSEMALKASTEKFIHRFELTEKEVIDSGKSFDRFTLEELDKFYRNAKGKKL